ncbi:MAG TPA: transcriptional repressor LexA [Anaerolineae bacterium]|nr:transcriptional repressor LexA [Anaerolineae bacterium]
MKTLTHRQLAVLSFIETFIASNRYPPTYEEIRRGLGLSTKSLVNHHLNALEEAGVIERDRLTSRGLRLAGQSVHMVPVVGSIVAGLPVTSFAESIDTAREALLLTSDIAAPQEGLFALRVRGDSMIDAMVSDGDLVVMKRQSDVRDGDMVAVWLKDRDETTLKRFFRENGRIRLQPANPTMGPIFAHPRNVEVQGKVVAVIRRVH